MALVVLARLHHVAGDPAQLRHHLGLAPSEELGRDHLLLAAQHLGLKAKLSRNTPQRLPMVALPALAFMCDGSTVLLAQCGAEQVLLQDFAQPSTPPQQRALKDFAAAWTGDLLLVSSRASLVGELTRFDFSWFIPALVKHRALLGEVLLVSTFLQIIGLLTPLFFQVVMDKVLVHRATNTLDARQREADVQGLAQQGFIAGHAGQDRTRERIELERDLATAKARLREAEAALVETQQSSLALVAELRRSLSDRLSKAQLELAQLGPAADKAAQQERLTRLTAPVAGTVQQLAVHTTGGVVTPAQPLLVVVPREADVVAEVFIENKDIGFVQVGQTAEVKLDTFNFTKYGTVPALVTSISADAVVDEERGAVFKAQLQLQRADIKVLDRAVRVSPGMLVKAEVRTGDRRVIDYLFEPFRSTISESARER